MAASEYQEFARNQQGSTLLIFMLVLVLAGTTILFSVLDSSEVKIERDKKTVAALAEAKAALIGYALKSGTLSGTARPGGLPCPDMHAIGALEGTSSSPCATDTVGRLPWKTLGLSDVRDGDGERLWYAVSSKFKNSPQTPILNSDTFGTITVRDTAGIIINDGSLESAAIAVIIAPGAPLTRADGVVQNRVATNYNAVNQYLDNFDSADNSKDEDNSNFSGSSTDGFIDGVIKESDAVIVNDRLTAIKYNDLMPSVEKRVANEVKKTLTSFGGLPWASSFTNPSLSNNNYIPRGNINGGLLPVFPHYWQINPVTNPVNVTGTVAPADVMSGFVEPGFCTQAGSQIACNGRKRFLIGTVEAWRDYSINVTGTLDATNSFSTAPMIGSLNITDTRVSDGSVLGTGSVTPTATTKISIIPQRSTLFPEWLTANNWHQMIYYAVATPFVYSSAYPSACGACLSVNYNGSLMPNIGSIVMMAGKRLDATDFQPVTPQIRPSANLYDYYDVINNQAGGTTFDWNRMNTRTFNDQLVIVAP